MLDSFPLDIALPAEGLTLGLPIEADIDDFYAACQDPAIARFTRVPAPYTIDHARAFVVLARIEAGAGAGLHLVARDDDGRVLGVCSVADVHRAAVVAEAGYWVAPWARRQGVATRSLRAACRWAFDTAGIERLYLLTEPENAASIGVASAVGFVQEGLLRQAVRLAHTDRPGAPRVDAITWGLLPGELR